MIKSFFDKIKGVLNAHVFNPKWKCNCCGKEIFSEEYFCEKCLENLPLIDKNYCQHCGRELKTNSEFCTSCKEYMISVDKARSVYAYKSPIDKMIKDLKYFGKKYLVEILSKDLANLYFKNYFNADFIVYVPMLEEAEKERGFNQSKLIAEKLSEKAGVPIREVVKKVKPTVRQAKLNRKERLKNLKGTFRFYNKKLIKDKTILIVDDVLTTGATSEVIGKGLKKYGAKAVYLLTVASVPNKEGY